MKEVFREVELCYKGYICGASHQSGVKEMEALLSSSQAHT